VPSLYVRFLCPACPPDQVQSCYCHTPAVSIKYVKSCDMMRKTRPGRNEIGSLRNRCHFIFTVVGVRHKAHTSTIESDAPLRRNWWLDT